MSQREKTSYSPASCPRARVAICAIAGFFAAVLAIHSGSYAQTLSLTDASFVTQSLVIDMNYFDLNQSEGLTAQTTYDSQPGGPGWIGSLTGGGANITYNFDTSQYSTNGTISWSASGSFGDPLNVLDDGTIAFAPDETDDSDDFDYNDDTEVDSTTDPDDQNSMTQNLNGPVLTDPDGNPNIPDPKTSGSGKWKGNGFTVIYPKGFDFSLTFAYSIENEQTDYYDSYLTVPPSGFALIDDDGSLNLFTGTITVTARSVLPEPSCLALLGIGAIGLMARRRRVA